MSARVISLGAYRRKTGPSGAPCPVRAAIAEVRRWAGWYLEKFLYGTHWDPDAPELRVFHLAITIEPGDIRIARHVRELLNGLITGCEDASCIDPELLRFLAAVDSFLEAQGTEPRSGRLQLCVGPQLGAGGEND